MTSEKHTALPVAVSLKRTHRPQGHGRHAPNAVGWRARALTTRLSQHGRVADTHSSPRYDTWPVSLKNTSLCRAPVSLSVSHTLAGSFRARPAAAAPDERDGAAIAIPTRSVLHVRAPTGPHRPVRAPHLSVLPHARAAVLKGGRRAPLPRSTLPLSLARSLAPSSIRRPHAAAAALPSYHKTTQHDSSPGAFGIPHLVFIVTDQCGHLASTVPRCTLYCVLSAGNCNALMTWSGGLHPTMG